MDTVSPFEHVSVLISIVLGLGLTQLLAAMHRLVQARARVRFYWLPLVWSALIFITQVEWWWSSFSMRQETRWNFFYFLFVLLSPVTLFLAAAFALPEVDAEGSYDLREFYYSSRGWFFAFVAAGPVLDSIRRAVQAGSITDFGAVSNLISAVMVATLAISRSPRWHTAVTLAVSALFLSFIVSSALELR